MKKDLKTAFESAINSGKLIHCITNPISINQCANGILALGSKPIMVEHPKEAAAITETAAALLLNLGNITDVRIKSIQISAKTAYKKQIPVVLDAVGTACSELRRKLALKLMCKYTPSVIKGNYSEIYALYRKTYKSRGVDADDSLNENAVAKAAAELAENFSCVVLASGKKDIVTDGKRCLYIQNGSEMLSRITGTGCLLGAVTAVMLTGGDSFCGAVAPCGIMGISGEIAEKSDGNGSFLVGLMDALSNIDTEIFSERLRMEEIKWTDR